MKDADYDAITSAGYPCYRFGDPAWNLVRLMCSFDTAKEDVEGLLSALTPISPASGVRGLG
jgi:hypothetical protein